MSKRSSWEIQRAVIMALMLRELKTRFGSYRLSYFWALFEPISHILILALIFGFVLGRTLPGINYPLFLTTGIMPWLLFSNMITRGMAAVDANRALFNYRQLKPFDTIIARMVLEAIIILTAYAILLLIAWWVGIDFAIHEPLRLILSLVLLFLVAFGLVLPLCYINTLYPEIGKVIPLLMRPLYFVSGIFFSISTIPQQYHAYLTWNPVLHAVELSRSAIFPGYPHDEASVMYLTAIAIILIAVGWSFFRHNTDRLVTT
ncbi:MAG: ABC transporter permease [Thiotrichales bacterium]